MNLLTHGGLGLLRCERDGQMRGALADPRGAAHGAWPVTLERRPLIGVDVLDAQVFAHELVVVLGVGDRGLEQLAPGLRGVTGREGEDRPRLHHVLAADVVAHQPRLAGGRAHVLGLRRDLEPDRDRLGLLGLAAAATPALALRLVLVGLAAAGARALRGLLGVLGGLFGLVGGLLGFARLAGALGLRLLSRGLGGLLGLLGELLGLGGGGLRRLTRVLGGLRGLLGGGSGTRGLLVGPLLLVGRLVGFGLVGLGHHVGGQLVDSGLGGGGALCLRLRGPPGGGFPAGPGPL